MIDFHTQEILDEIMELISNYFEECDEISDLDERSQVADDLLQDILDKISHLVGRDDG